jgi:hypothetical protein
MPKLSKLSKMTKIKDVNHSYYFLVELATVPTPTRQALRPALPIKDPWESVPIRVLISKIKYRQGPIKILVILVNFNFSHFFWLLSTHPDPAAWILSIHLPIMISKLNLSTANTGNKK